MVINFKAFRNNEEEDIFVEIFLFNTRMSAVCFGVLNTCEWFYICCRKAVGANVLGGVRSVGITTYVFALR